MSVLVSVTFSKTASKLKINLINVKGKNKKRSAPKASFEVHRPERLLDDDLGVFCQFIQCTVD